MKIGNVLMAMAIVASLPGCVAGVEGEPGFDESSELSTREQAFLGFSSQPNYLMDRVATGELITACLMGSNVDSGNFTNRKTRIANAMVKWATAARGAGISVPTFDANDIFFHTSATCMEQPDVHITWDAPADGHVVWHSNGFIYVKLTGDVTEHDMLHEMGHVFGLHDTYWKDHEGCLPGQAPSVMCGRSVPGGVGFTSLQTDDINGVREIYCVANPSATECNRRAEWDINWCTHSGAKMHVGDFNGDSRDDLLCHDVNDGRVWTRYAGSTGRFGSSSWSRSMGFCFGANKELHVGDFNNDDHIDLLCHDRSSGSKTIAWASSAGEFSETNLTTTNPSWCNHSTGKLHVGDFDADGSADVLCHDTSSGHAWIDYRNDGLNGTDWNQALSWCNHSGAKLRIGNVDGDSDDDIVCQDTNTGKIWIDYASLGVFAGTNSTYDDAFCYGTNGQLFIEDFNSDGKEDLMCHNPSSGFKKIALATTSSGTRFVGVSRQWQMSWCYGSTQQFFAGDFDNNGSADFLCHDTGESYKWQAFQYP